MNKGVVKFHSVGEPLLGICFTCEMTAATSTRFPFFFLSLKEVKKSCLPPASFSATTNIICLCVQYANHKESLFYIIPIDLLTVIAKVVN